MGVHVIFSLALFITVTPITAMLQTTLEELTDPGIAATWKDVEESATIFRVFANAQFERLTKLTQLVVEDFQEIKKVYEFEKNSQRFFPEIQTIIDTLFNKINKHSPLDIYSITLPELNDRLNQEKITEFSEHFATIELSLANAKNCLLLITEILGSIEHNKTHIDSLTFLSYQIQQSTQRITELTTVENQLKTSINSALSSGVRPTKSCFDFRLAHRIKLINALWKMAELLPYQPMPTIATQTLEEPPSADLKKELHRNLLISLNRELNLLNTTDNLKGLQTLIKN